MTWCWSRPPRACWTRLDEATGDAFAGKTGFDPRQLDNYTFYRVVPREIRAWREVNELAHRLLMRDGRWLDA